MPKKLTTNNLKLITNQFYSAFCGIDIAQTTPGIHFVPYPERDELLKGFGCKYTMFILLKEDICIVSYSPKYQSIIETLKNCSTDNMLEILKSTYNLKKMQLMEFDEEVIFQFDNARILTDEDYLQYEKFFCETHTGASPDGWLNDYFTEKSAKGFFVGCFAENKLVSVSDAPDMPYLEDKIQHTGIYTLKEFRKKGYAKSVSALATHNLIENGICPQWECHADNTASIALAKSIGYKEYAVAYILEE